LDSLLFEHKTKASNIQNNKNLLLHHLPPTNAHNDLTHANDNKAELKFHTQIPLNAVPPPTKDLHEKKRDSEQQRRKAKKAESLCTSTRDIRAPSHLDA
jgi:hypothetical protein